MQTLYIIVIKVCFPTFSDWYSRTEKDSHMLQPVEEPHFINEFFPQITNSAPLLHNND